MDLFESTLKVKDFIHEGNNSLIKLGEEIECSCSGISMLFSFDEIKTVEDYHNKTRLIALCKGLYDLPNEIITAKRVIDFEKVNARLLLRNTPAKINTKEYWNFLHREFQYCDVMTYPIFPNLVNYFATKGPLYDAKIDLLPGKLQFFKKKKILEIGGGYGYLPKLLNDNKIKHTYYHADIVRRFDCDNFIELDGYNLSNFIHEKFDIVLLFDVFQHLNAPTIKAYFKELRPLLNDDGYILIDTPFLNKEHWGIGTFFAQAYVTPSETEFIEILDNNHYSYQRIDYYCYTHLEGCFYIITLKNKNESINTIYDE